MSIRSLPLLAVLALFPSLPAMGNNAAVEAQVDAVLARMTLDEKIGQLEQFTLNPDFSVTERLVREGRVGSILSTVNVKAIDRLQRIAVEESRLGIPLIFGRDVIHGYRTVFPIPLGQACSWNPDLVQEGARIAANEATVDGIQWTFAPMVDIARDPRWGRIAEGYGEDPFLASAMAAASVKGFQGDDLTDRTRVLACVKHFAGYGASEGGRDYNTTLIPTRELRDIYLPPFKAAIDAGARTLMTGFNDLDGVPVSANHLLLDDILRDEWGFDGLVLSDFGAIRELVKHGFAQDMAEAAARALDAGVDMEMGSSTYLDHLKNLVAAGVISESLIDARVRNILRVKFEMGLFEHPFRIPGREDVLLSADHLAAAREMAAQSAVLLSNKGVLPLRPGGKVAVIGPMADAPYDQLGTWALDGDPDDSRTVLAALKERLGKDHVIYARGLPTTRSLKQDGFPAAVAAAKKADVALLFVGEEAFLSGEAHSRSDISLPGAQEALVKAVADTGTPVVMVVMAGRPITFSELAESVDAVLVAFHSGTMAGPALADLLTGDRSPSGRLPLTWPVAVGQVPIYYNQKNTGRPASGEFKPLDKLPAETRQSILGFTSFYLDIGYHPAYPFGHGLTYSKFSYKDLELSATQVPLGGSIEVSATIRNTGGREATEVVQLYVHDVSGSVTRPVRELKGFQRVTLAPGESRSVKFTLHTDDLSFTNEAMKHGTEPGKFTVWIAPNAAEGLEGTFEVK